MTQLRVQLRDAAEREARRGPARRAARTASVPALAAVAVALLAAAVLVTGAWLRGPDTTQPADRDALRIASNTPLATQGGLMATGFGAVWVADPSGQVLRVDPGTERVVARIPTAPETPIVAAGAGAVWALGADARLLRIDPGSNRVVARIRLPLTDRSAADLVVAPGVVWVTTGVALLHVDLRRNVIDRRVSLEHDGLEARSGTVGEGSIFVLGRDGVLDRLDLRTGKRLSSTRPALEGFTFGSGGGNVFLAAGDGVAAIDAGTGDTAWRRPLDVQRVNGAVPAGGDLWVQGTPMRGGRDRLWRLDASSGRLLGSLTLPEFGVTGAAVVRDRLWLMTPGGRLMIVAGA